MGRSFEERLERVREAVSRPDDADARKVLTQTLRGKDGYLISVVAAGVGARFLSALPRAFGTLLVDPIKRDPSCRGKLAVAKALYDADERAEEVYLAGSRHVQLEPVWGGREDTAAPLRGVCVMALVHQQHPRAMVEAARLLVDKERAARIAAARAVGASGNAEVGEPLLRLKIAAGEGDGEVLGECFGALLEVAGGTSFEFVVGYLDDAREDVAEAAALALGGARSDGAFAALRDRAEEWGGAERRRVLFLAIALLRTDEAWGYLIERVGDAAPPTATAAIEALATFRHDDALRDRVLQAADERGDARVLAAAREAFAEPEQE